jgi:hypothetical protein
VAHRVYKQHAVCPANTPATNPLVADMSFPDGNVTRITIQIPTGWCGLAGIQLLQAHTPVIPINGVNYLSGDGVVFDTEYQDDLKNGNWQVRMINTDIYDHGAYITLYVDELVLTPPPNNPLPLPVSPQGVLL